MKTESNGRVAVKRYQRPDKKMGEPVKIKGQSLPQIWNSKDLEEHKDLVKCLS